MVSVHAGDIKIMPHFCQVNNRAKHLSTLFVRLPQAWRLPSIHAPTIAPMPPLDGRRLEANLYNPFRDGSRGGPSPVKSAYRRAPG